MAENKELISKSKLLEAGVYFGHKKAVWNPKMKPYISKIQKGTHIIDIEKTKKTLTFVYDLIKNYAEKGGTFVFVGTRKQAKATIKENALRTNSWYVSERWLGGTLTNSRTIFQRVRRMEHLEKLQANHYEGYTKKEGLLFDRELYKLHKNLQGIRTMRRKPNVMIIADPSHDQIAIKEAKKLGVRTIGIVDTNNDPTSVNIAIPANDDSLKSMTLIITLLADAIAEAKGGVKLFAHQNDSDIILPEDPKKDLRSNFLRTNKFRSSNRYDNYKKRLTPRNSSASSDATKTRPNTLDVKKSSSSNLDEQKTSDLKK